MYFDRYPWSILYFYGRSEKSQYFHGFSVNGQYFYRFSENCQYCMDFLGIHQYLNGFSENRQYFYGISECTQCFKVEPEVCNIIMDILELLLFQSSSSIVWRMNCQNICPLFGMTDNLSVVLWLRFLSVYMIYTHINHNHQTTDKLSVIPNNRQLFWQSIRQMIEELH